MALISLLPLIALLTIFSIILGSRDGKARAKKYHDSLEEMNAGIVEFVRAMPVMKIFGQSASAFAKYSDTVENVRSSHARLDTVDVSPLGHDYQLFDQCAFAAIGFWSVPSF